MGKSPSTSADVWTSNCAFFFFFFLFLKKVNGRVSSCRYVSDAERKQGSRVWTSSLRNKSRRGHRKSRIIRSEGSSGARLLSVLVVRPSRPQRCPARRLRSSSWWIRSRGSSLDSRSLIYCSSKTRFPSPSTGRCEFQWFESISITKFAIHRWLTWDMDFFTRQGIPGPKPLPFIGNWWGVWKRVRS